MHFVTADCVAADVRADVVNPIKVHMDFSKPWLGTHENAIRPFDILFEFTVYHLESTPA